MKLSIKKYVEQVVDDKKYKGTITIQDKYKLIYTLNFAVPISKLDYMKEEDRPSDIEGARKLFQLEIKREDETPVEINDEEFGFFMKLIVNFAVEFYNLPQTRDANEGVLGSAARGAQYNVLGKASLGIKSSADVEASPELCKMLGEKVGASLCETKNIPDQEQLGGGTLPGGRHGYGCECWSCRSQLDER